MNTHRRTTLAWLCSAGGLAACGGADKPEPAEAPLTRINAAWRTGTLTRTYVVRNDAEWQGAWLLNEPATEPRTTRPGVDFSTTMVLGLSLGTAPTGCDEVRIRRVVETSTEVRVEYRYGSVSPGPIVVCTLAFVALVDFVMVRKIDKPVVFVSVND